MATRGNILLVANWPSDVGYAWWLMENYWACIAEHFAPAMQTHLVYPQIITIPDTIAATDIVTVELDMRDHSAENLVRIRRYIEDNDIRYVYLSDHPSYSRFYARLHNWGIATIVVHDHTPGDRTTATGIKRLLKSIVQRLPCITADHFIAVTDFVRQRFTDVACIPAHKCSVARNGIHPIDTSSSDPQRVNRLFGIPEDGITVITTGRASAYKGIDFFIRCAHRMVIEQGQTSLYFLFCGDGPDMQRFRALAGELGLGEHMVFAGKRSDVREILPSCDIGFHASQGEVGYSLSILEYMSAGLATIVSDRPSTSAATQHDVNGLLYRRDDIDSACEMLERCLNGVDRRRLGEQASRDVRERYDINETNRQLLAALDEVFV